MLPQVLAQKRNHIALAVAHRRAFANGQLFSSRRDHGPGLGAEKGVAPNLLAALNRFQQKRILLPRRDAEECGYRSKQIRAQSFGDRNESGVAAELQKASIVGCQHGSNWWTARRFVSEVVWVVSGHD